MECVKCGRLATTWFKAEGHGRTQESWLCDQDAKDVWRAIDNAVTPFGTIEGRVDLTVTEEDIDRMLSHIKEVSALMEQHGIPSPVAGFELPTQMPE
jgi:hypothetical protein